MEIIKKHNNYEILYEENIIENINKISKLALKNENDIRLIRFCCKMFSLILLITIIITVQNDNLKQDIYKMLSILGYGFGIITVMFFLDYRSKIIKYKNITDLYTPEIENVLKLFNFLNNCDMLDPVNEIKDYVFTFKDNHDYIERIKIKKNSFYISKEKYKETNTIVLDFTSFDWEKYFKDFFKNYNL